MFRIRGCFQQILVTIPSHQPTPSWRGRASHSFSSEGVGKKNQRKERGNQPFSELRKVEPMGFSYNDQFVGVGHQLWVWLFSSLVGGLNRPISKKCSSKWEFIFPKDQGENKRLFMKPPPRIFILAGTFGTISKKKHSIVALGR